MNMTHIHQVSEKIKNTSLLVARYTGLREDQMSNFFMEIGMCWAEQFCNDNAAYNYLIAQSEFWGFWRLEWQKAEDMFLELMTYDVDRMEYYFKAIGEDGTVYRVWDQEGIRYAYCFFMNNKMTECVGNKVLLELAFHKFCKKNG